MFNIFKKKKKVIEEVKEPTCENYINKIQSNEVKNYFNNLPQDRWYVVGVENCYGTLLSVRKCDNNRLKMLKEVTNVIPFIRKGDLDGGRVILQVYDKEGYNFDDCIEQKSIYFSELYSQKVYSI